MIADLSNPDVLSLLLQGWQALFMVVGAASAVVAVIGKVTAITPNKADDELLSKLGRAVGWVQATLDRVALNPSTRDARKHDDEADQG